MHGNGDLEFNAYGTSNLSDLWVKLTKASKTFEVNANGNKIKMDSTGIVVDNGVAKATFKADKIAIGANAVEILAKMSETLDKIATWVDTYGATHTHIGNLGAPTLPPNSAVQWVQLKTDLNTIKAAIDSIKGTL
jgi:hypothetical protein